MQNLYVMRVIYVRGDDGNMAKVERGSMVYLYRMSS